MKMAVTRSSAEKYPPNSVGFLEAYCHPGLWVMRLLGLVQLGWYGKSDKCFLRLIDYTLCGWSTGIFFLTFPYCTLWATAGDAQPMPRTPMELMIASVKVLFEVCGPLSYLGLVISFWPIMPWLTDCSGKCQLFLTAKNKVYLRLFAGLLFVVFASFLRNPIWDISYELKHSVSRAHFSTLLRVFSDPTLGHTIAVLAYGAVLVYETLSILAQSLLTFITATMACALKTTCQKYDSAAIEESEKILNEYTAMCAQLRALSNGMKFWLLPLCFQDFIWALFFVTVFRENGFSGIGNHAYLAFTLTLSAVRTVALVNVEIQAKAMGDVVAARILTTTDLQHQKNAIMRLSLVDREYNGFTAGELIRINREFIVGFIGLLVTYTLISWDDK